MQKDVNILNEVLELLTELGLPGSETVKNMRKQLYVARGVMKEQGGQHGCASENDLNKALEPGPFEKEAPGGNIKHYHKAIRGFIG